MFLMAKTIGSFQELQKVLPANWAEDSKERESALKTYLAMGGIIKIGEIISGWPELIYPTSSRITSLLIKIEKEMKVVDRQIKDWRGRNRDLAYNNVKHVAKRVADPLFWEHKTKLMVDPSYRKTFVLVEPPMHLLHKSKWRKRLRMFVRDKEYRLRLHEARTSIIGKKRQGMSKEEEKRMDFTRNFTDIELNKLVEKRKILHRQKNALRTLLTWSKSKPKLIKKIHFKQGKKATVR